MPFQHYLPATFLACFSTDSNPERRQRMLAVGDKKDGRIFSAPASKVCGINDFYSLSNWSDKPDLIDSAWSFYEKGLASALEQLINGTLPCQTWANTLVPFVTGLLIRGPDFNQRFENRLVNLGIAELAQDGNTNTARLIENQRLSASVVGAKWMVLQTRGVDPLITNDLGYAPCNNPMTRDFGIAIPISLEHVLVIAPKLKRKIAVALGGTWWPIIEYMELPDNNHIGLNQSIASISQRFIFGPDNEVVGKNLPFQKENAVVPEPIYLGFMNSRLARIHEMTWIRLITALLNPPIHDGDFIYVDYIKNARRT